MRDQNTDKLLELEVGGKSLREWEQMWKPVPGGFATPQPALRGYVGLMRAKLTGNVMYIMRAAEHKKGGIEKGLQRIRGVPQTGNKGFGAQQLRAHIDELELEVLIAGQDSNAAQLAKDLKVLMVKYHDPEWNRPHGKRMRDLRAGTLKKK